MENETPSPLKIEYWHPPTKEIEGQAVEVAAPETVNKDAAEAARLAARQRRSDIAVSVGAVAL